MLAEGQAVIDNGQHLCLAVSGGCLGAIASGQHSWTMIALSTLSTLVQLAILAWTRRRR